MDIKIKIHKNNMRVAGNPTGIACRGKQNHSVPATHFSPKRVHVHGVLKSPAYGLRKFSRCIDNVNGYSGLYYLLLRVFLDDFTLLPNAILHPTKPFSMIEAHSQPQHRRVYQQDHENF